MKAKRNAKPVPFGTHDPGYHNADWKRTQERLLRGGTYRDLSTVIVCPSRGAIPCKIVSSWMSLMRPMNQKVIGPIFATKHEVGRAYCELFEMILDNPELSRWKYIHCIEEDNAPPPDGLLQLYESIEGGVDGVKYDAVGGLYWVKGDGQYGGGQPMAYGKPEIMPKNFIPWLPPRGTVARVNGLGQGFTLFRMSMFKDPALLRPWFRTQQDYIPGKGTQGYSQDLYLFSQAGALGYKFAIDTRVLVGHYDAENDMMW